jgi:DNA-binding NarL/FixJ family response regulator
MRLLIADDDHLVRAGLRALLGTQPDFDVVGEAGTGQEVLERARTLDPDVVLMDVRMPELDGIEATRQLVERDQDRLRVLVISTFENDVYVYEALRAGASGFVLKRAQPGELFEAVRLVASGESLVLPALTRRLVERFSPFQPADRRRAELLRELTDRESEILRWMAAGNSNTEIASGLVIALHTVKSHVASILLKLEVRDRTQAVIAAYETGYVRPGHGTGAPGR